MTEQLLYSTQIFSISVVIAYLLARVSFFSDPHASQISLEKSFWAPGLSPKKLVLVICVFSFISIYPLLISFFSGAEVIVNTTMVGVALAGFLFGATPAVLVAVAVSVLIVFSGTAAVVPNLIAIFLAAIVCSLARRHYEGHDALLFGIILGFLEIIHALLIVALVQPVETAKEIIYTTSFSMILINACTVLVFVALIDDLHARDRLLAKEAVTKSELGVASRIQMSLLSNDFLGDKRYDFHSLLVPAREVGGDLYAFSPFDKNRFIFILGDVSGKGISAALTMSRTITLFQAALRERRNSNEQPEHLVESISASLNDSLCKNNSTQIFVTATIGCLDLETGLYVYTSAGHPASYLCQAGQTPVRLERPKGPALGIIEGKSYSSKSLQLKPNQYLLNYTDGISEAENAELEQFGEERIVETFTDCTSLKDAQSINEQLLLAVKRFVGEAPQSDDIAISCLGWKPQQEDNHCDSNSAQNLDYTVLHSNEEAKEGHLSYRMPNTLPALFSLLESLAPSLDNLGVSGSRQDNLALVIEELLSNIVKYGYSDQRAGSIELELFLYGAGNSESEPVNEAAPHSEPEGANEQSSIPATALHCGPEGANKAASRSGSVLTNDRIIIRDDADSYDPTQAPRPDMGIEAKDRPIGGLGLALVRKRIDSFSYTSSEGINTLRCDMKKGSSR